MAPLGTSVRNYQRSSASSNQVRSGVYHRGLNTLSRLSTNTASATASVTVRSANTGISARNVPRNAPRRVPRPVQTSSLRKENGGQDINAVLVNRQGSGKTIGWGSALPAPVTKEPSSTPGSTKPENNNNNQSANADNKQLKQQHPPLPPPPTASNKNVPWALHPPSNQDPPPAGAGNMGGPEDNLSGPASYHTDGKREGSLQQRPYQQRYNQSRDHVDRGREDRFQRQDYDDSFGAPRGHRGEAEDYYQDRRYQAPSQRCRGDSYDRPYSRRVNYDIRGERRENRDYRSSYDSYGENHRGGYSRERDSSFERRPHAPDSYERSSYHSRSTGYNRHDNERRSANGDMGHDNRTRYGVERFDEQQRRPFRDNRHFGECPSSDRDRSRNVDRERFGGETTENRFGRDDQGTDNIAKEHSNSRIITSHDPHQQEENAVSVRNSQLHQPPPQSEEDIIMQSIRERRAAEERSRLQKKEAESTKDQERHKPSSQEASEEPSEEASRSDAGKRTVHEDVQIEPTGILRRSRGDSVSADEVIVIKKGTDSAHETLSCGKNEENNSVEDVEMIGSHDQTSGEASGSAIKPEDPAQDKKQIGHHQEKNAKEEVNRHLEEEVDKHLEEEGDGHLEEELDKHSKEKVETNSDEEMGKHIIKGTDNSQQITNEVQVSDARQSAFYENADIEQPAIHEKLDEATELAIAAATREHAKQKADRAAIALEQKNEQNRWKQQQQTDVLGPIEQQQNILRHVAASRKSNSVSSGQSEDASSIKNRQESENVSAPGKLDKAEREAILAAAKAARAEDRKTRGPRTNGVLFRKLPDGSIVNADLSEEELTLRAERKLAKLNRMKQKKIDAKRSRSKKNAEASTEVDVPVTPKSKPFVLAPPPAVSAWNAGPPPGFMMKVSPTSHDASDSDDESIGASDGIASKASSEQNSSPRFGSDARWTPTEMVPGIATWSTFGGTPIPGETLGIQYSGFIKNQEANGVSNWPTDGDEAALTDASDAVPRDLLSSAPGSEADQISSTEADKKKKNKHPRNGGRKKGGYNSRRFQRQKRTTSEKSENNKEKSENNKEKRKPRKSPDTERMPRKQTSRRKKPSEDGVQKKSKPKRSTRNGHKQQQKQSSSNEV